MSKLIIGLGNPGNKYKNTRHNVGYMLVAKFRKTKSFKAIAVPTNVPMNNSGVFVEKLVGKGALERIKLYIVHDDLDIPLGKYKIQKGKGPKDHNGLKSVYKALGTKDFYHVRIGVESRTMNGDQRTKGEDYVLQDFTGPEKKVLDKVLSEVCAKITA